MDCIFLHVPKKNDKFLRIVTMPLGLAALANYLIENGIKTKILHLILEERMDYDFEINKYIKDNNVKIVCLDLHWHHQSHSVIETAKNIKKTNPSIKIILGGFTASIFSKEIMQKFNEIDFTIKGDAEVPLATLIKKILKNEITFEEVPNLFWRKNKQIIENPHSYIINQEILDSLKYSNFKTISNYHYYHRIHKYEKLLEVISVKTLLEKAASYVCYNPGRGCSVNCSYCGGSNISQVLINNRSKVLIKSIDSALKDLKGFMKYGIDNVYVCFDPFPKSDYYIKLFQAVKNAGLSFNLLFECFDLPSKEFIDAFKTTFKDKSRLILSPDTGSETVRKQNKGFYYSNEKLIKTLDNITNNNIDCDVYFSVGLPFEQESDINKTRDLIKLLKNKYNNKLNIIIESIELDPGCPMWMDNKKYKIKSKRTSFMNFYKGHAGKPSLGYCTQYLNEKTIHKHCDEIEKNIISQGK